MDGQVCNCHLLCFASLKFDLPDTTLVHTWTFLPHLLTQFVVPSQIKIRTFLLNLFISRYSMLFRFTNEKLWYKASATNARRKILPKHLMNQFANKQIVCIEYSDLSGDQEREIFQVGAGASFRTTSSLDD